MEPRVIAQLFHKGRFPYQWVDSQAMLYPLALM